MVSGLESFVKREIDLLVELGLKIDVFTIKHTQSTGFEPNPKCEVIKPSPYNALLQVLKMSIFEPVLLFSIFAEAFKLKGLLELTVALSWRSACHKKNYKLIHSSFGDRKFYVAFFLAKLCKKPFTTTIHAHEIYAPANKRLFVHALRHAHGITTISKKNRHILIDEFSVQEKKIKLIPLTIDPCFWQRSTAVVVLTVARFTPRKGWDDLFKAAKILGTNYKFIAVGFGPLDLYKLAQKYNVSNQITIFPKLGQNQIRELMEHSDVFCLPSKASAKEGSEGVPVALMEAMAMELPIVTTNDGSIEELVDDIIVPQNNPKLLAKAISEITTITTNKKSRYPINRNKVLKLHNPQNIEKLIDFFEETYTEFHPETLV